MKKSQRGYNTTKMSDVWVLFIVEENERNLGDQKCLESELYDGQGIKTLRATFTEVWKSYEIDQVTKVLRVQGREIGLVYYRTGYQYEQYTCESDWKTRELLELSMAIKCPSIDFHLLTLKIFQEVFSDDAVLKRVMGDENIEG